MRRKHRKFGMDHEQSVLIFFSIFFLSINWNDTLLLFFPPCWVMNMLRAGIHSREDVAGSASTRLPGPLDAFFCFGFFFLGAVGWRNSEGSAVFGDILGRRFGIF